MVGDFEKPKYFRYKERLCAHSRNRQVGCTACIDICSARAIASAGDRVSVNPYLCAGCGACTTVCPSGALAYAYPGAPYTGERLRTRACAPTRGRRPRPGACCSTARAGQRAGRDAGRRQRRGQSRGVPARVIPLELHHTASTGIDVWLSAIAYGAGGVAVLMTDDEAPQYAGGARQTRWASRRRC